jgi:hypothetical protein
MLTRCRLFAGSAFLMTLSTAVLVWLYGAVNGRKIEEVKDIGNGSVTKKMRSGNVKSE